MAEETTQTVAPKKEKAPKLEDKPFEEFVKQDYIPAIETALNKKGVTDLKINFTKQKIAIAGFTGNECWQLAGNLSGGKRKFHIYFPDEDIQALKYFSCYEGNKPSTLEHFLGDEKKITLDLMVFGLVQRLNGQKWLSRN